MAHKIMNLTTRQYIKKTAALCLVRRALAYWEAYNTSIREISTRPAPTAIPPRDQSSRPSPPAYLPTYDASQDTSPRMFLVSTGRFSRCPGDGMMRYLITHFPDGQEQHPGGASASNGFPERRTDDYR